METCFFFFQFFVLKKREGVGWGRKRSGGLKWPQKPKNFRWPEKHSELSVCCFFIQWCSSFTANFTIETCNFLTFLFFWEGGDKGGRGP